MVGYEIWLGWIHITYRFGLVWMAWAGDLIGMEIWLHWRLCWVVSDIWLGWRFGCIRDIAELVLRLVSCLIGDWLDIWLC